MDAYGTSMFFAPMLPAASAIRNDSDSPISMPRVLVGLGSALAAALVSLAAGTQVDWELRVGASGGRLHWSFEHGQCQAPTTNYSPTATYHIGVHHWACIACKRAQNRACQATPRQTGIYNWDLRVGASGGRLHWSFEHGQCDAMLTGRLSRTSTRACDACTRAQSQACQAAHLQTDNHAIKTATAAQMFSLVAIPATVFLAILLTCERVLRARIRRSKAHAPVAGPSSEPPGAGLSSETTDAPPKGKSTTAADTDEDDLGLIGRARKSVFEAFAMPKGFREQMLAKTHHEAAHVAANEDEDEPGRARKSVFESFAMPKLREEVLAKRPDLLVHEATHAAADEDEPATPVGRARNSVFETFAMPNLRNEVAAKVTHEAKESAPDGDRYSDGMIRMGTERKSFFQNFAIDMPSLRGEVAAKKAQPAKRTRADKNSVYSGAPVRKDPTPALALTLPLTLAPNLALLSTPTTNQASPSRSLTLTLTRS